MNKNYKKPLAVSNDRLLRILKTFDARAIALAFILEQLNLRKKNDKQV
jgi:hypothetical protein